MRAKLIGLALASIVALCGTPAPAAYICEKCTPSEAPPGGGTPPEGGTPPAGFYVAPTGDDGAAGTFEAPFKTLGKCQTTIRAATPKICTLRAGKYPLPAAGLVLTAADNNETWEVYGPDGLGSAILSGTGLNANTMAIMTSPDSNGITFKGLKIEAPSYIVVFSRGNNTIWVDNVLDGLNTNPWYGLDIYGDNLLVARNTIENLNGSGAFGIFFNSTGVTNTVIRDNKIQCNSHFGIYVGANATNNIVGRNKIIGIGHVGGPPPGCGPLVDHAGTAMTVENSKGNLFVDNDVEDAEGYTIVISNSGGANWIDNNRLDSNSDPIITLNGAPGTAIVHNIATSPGSIGFNLGDEHDACPRTNTSNDLFVSDNEISAAYEPLYLTSTRNSTIQGNSGHIGTSPTGGTAPHYAAGITLVHWTAAAACAPVQNNGKNIIQLNSFTSKEAAAQYGVWIDKEQTDNTLAFNVLFPYGTPGVAAIKDQSGGKQTTGNQTTADASPLNKAPPIAHAGLGKLVGAGRTITLDASGSRLINGAPACEITYRWAQLSGPQVTIENPTAVKASFTTPVVNKPTILGFEVTATDTNGSTQDRVYFGVDPSLAE